MTNAWFLGAAQSVPQDESEVRSTMDPVRTDGENAEAQRVPEWNEDQTDNSGELMGLAPRVKGSATFDSEKYVPGNIGLATDEHNAIIDRQVATSGTAAAREAAGVQGHGTLQYAVGIEPLNPANRMGNDYFQRGPLEANEGSGNYMTPVSTDNWGQAVSQAVAVKNSRDAYMGSLYADWIGG